MAVFAHNSVYDIFHSHPVSVCTMLHHINVFLSVTFFVFVFDILH